MGRKSEITKWRAELREELERLLSSGQHTHAQIVDHLRTLGVSTSKSAVQRYGAKYEDVARELRMMREMAQVCGQEFAERDGEAQRLIVESMQSLLMKVRLKYVGEESVDPNEMRALAQSAASLATAMKTTLDIDAKIRKRLGEIADKTAATLKRVDGVSDATIEMIKAQILGVDLPSAEAP